MLRSFFCYITMKKSSELEEYVALKIPELLELPKIPEHQKIH